jgi:hypothetical protein
MISKLKSLRVFAFLFLLFVAAVRLFANVSGSISGYVRDPSHLPVPSVLVKATEIDNGIVRSVRTGPSGAFTFPALAPGRYVIHCFAPGFAASRIDDVILNEDQALQLDVPLQLDTSRQSVEVRGSRTQVEHESTQAGDVLTANVITALALNGRSYTDLMALQPGVSPISAGTLPGSVTLGGSVHRGNVSISGSRESANAFEVNGGEVEEPRLNGTAIVPDVDSIAEFRIVTAGADAEYGHYSGAMVSVVTKSGGNEFHGTGFEFLRNQDLDARNFFASERARFQRNQVGGALGGPVKRNRAFFFVDYQDTREDRGLETGEVLVPTGAERLGDFSDAASALTGSVSSRSFASYLSSRLGYPVIAGEPYYIAGCSSSASCVFPNGVIPRATITEPAKNLLSNIPVPTNGDVFTSSANNNRLRDGIGALRLDLNSDRNMFQFYGSDDRSSLWKQFGTNNIPGYPTTDTVVAQHANLGYTRIFSAGAANEAHFTVTRYVVNTDIPDAGTGAGTLNRLGFAAGSSGGLVAAVPALEGVPPITFNDLSIGTPQFSYNAFETTLQVRDDFSLVRGKHALKFGANAESTRFIDRFPLLFGNGAFSFSGAETGNDFADFLIGAPTTFTQQSNIDADERKPYFGVYGEDSWRMSPNLTVNAGLRWEYLPAFSEQSGQKATFAAGQQSTVFPNAPEGILYPSDHLPGFGTIPRSISRTPLDNFGPRIGLAYSPSFSNGIGRIFGAPGMTSIRVSYGIYYGTIEGIGAYFGDPPVPFTTLYVAASPPYFAQPYVDRATGTIHTDPFPNNTTRPDKNVDFSPFEPIIGVPAASVHNVTPYSEKYSASIERALDNKVLFRVAYTGAEGHHLEATLPNNPGNPQQCLALSIPANLDPTSPVCGPFGEDTTYTTSDGRVLFGMRAPFGGPNFGDNSDVTTIANSSYNALQASLHWVTNKFTFLAAYTYAKSLDDSSAFDDAPLNPFNYRLSRSLSAFDLTQELVLSYVYDFKSWHRRGWDKLLSGWKLAGITRFASGVPVTLYENDDRSLLGLLGSGIGIFVPIDEPDYAGTTMKFSNPRSGRPYFDTSGFSAEPPGRLGTANRRFIHGPGIDNFDVALLKETAVSERVNMELRFEFFNGLNHAQFLNPSGNFSNTANFGVVRSARDPRIGQVAVKLIF